MVRIYMCRSRYFRKKSVYCCFTEGEKREKLDKVYATWQQRMGSTHPEITVSPIK